MVIEDKRSRWGLLALAGTAGVCCLSLGALFGGAAVVGGGAAGVTAASGIVRSFGGLVITGIATAVTLLVIGLLLRRTARGS